MIGAAQIEKLKPGVRLINAARGGIYDEAALAEGLKAGKIGGVALDVYANEPCTDSPLFGMPGVVCTPHLGCEHRRSADAGGGRSGRAARRVSDDRRDSARGERGVARCEDARVAARLSWMSPIGWACLLAGMEPSGLRSCRLLYRGEIADKETKVLTAVFAAGLLQGALDQEVNLVNAELLLKQRGIKLTEESRSEMGSFRSSMTAEVTHDRGTHKAAGTIFGQHMPRLVSLDDFRLEAYLDGRLLGVPPPRRAGHHRRRGHDLRPAQREHRPDGGRPRGARRRGGRRAQSRRRALGRGPGRGAAAAGDHVGDGGPPAAGRAAAGWLQG